MGTIFDKIRDEYNNYFRTMGREPNTLIINYKLLTELYNEANDLGIYAVIIDKNLKEKVMGMDIVETNKEDYLKACVVNG